VDRAQSGLQGAPGSQGPSKGNSDGEVDYAGRKWKWSQVVDDMPIPGVFSIVVKVRPSDVTASGDNAWYADVTGVMGDAVGAPRGDLPSWNVTPGQGGTPRPDGLAPGASPPAPASPVPGAPPVFNPQNPVNPTTPHQSTNPTSPTPLPTSTDETRAAQRGFTLIELMVAVFITAIVLSMGYGAVNQALNNHEALDARQERLLAVQTTMRLLTQDFTQLAPRPVRQPLGDGWLPALLAGTSTGTGMGLSGVNTERRSGTGLGSSFGAATNPTTVQARATTQHEYEQQHQFGTRARAQHDRRRHVHELQ
jgi:prepilin-type N-terminal cleavage/methylation domain-containing protein